MNLTKVLIGRPILTTMLFGVIAILGLLVAVRLPISELPKIDFPAVVVQVGYPGADSNTIEQQVTKPVEQAVGQVNGITQLTAVSATGSSTVIAQMDTGIDVDTVASDMSQAVSRIGRQLPDGTTSPIITKANPYASPLLVISYSGASAQQLYNLVTQTVQPNLQLIPGVGGISVNGGLATQVNVVLDPRLLAARGISVNQVTQAITAQNVNLSGGTVTSGPTATQVTTGGQGTTAGLNDLVIGSTGGAPVHLNEVGTVTEGPADASRTSDLDGNPSVSLAITARDGANAITTADQIQDELTKLDPEIPAGMTRTVVSDQTKFTKAALSATVEDLILAVILASLVILVFLQDLRQTVIVLIAIPTSLLATALMMYFLHFSLDIMSLLALSLLIGILVDDAIVVIENITRHLQMGKRPADAAYEGRMEIGAAAVALTLTDVIVFLPMVFTGGVIGQILLEFGVTIVVATLFSLLVSFTVTPVLSALWLRQRPLDGARRVFGRVGDGLARGEQKVIRGYRRMLRASLHYRPWTMALGVLAVVLSAGLITTGRLGVDYVPEQDAGVINVNAQLPPGTSLDTTGAVLTQLSNKIRTNIPGVADVYATAGGGLLGTNTGTLTVDLVPKAQRGESIDDTTKRITAVALGIPTLLTFASVPNPLVPPTSSGLPVIIRGPDLNVLNQLAGQAANRLRVLDSLSRVQSTASAAGPGWSIQINQDQARTLGLTSQQVAQAVATAISGTDVTTIQTSGGLDEPLHVSVQGGAHFTADQLLALPVGQTTAPAGSPAAASASSASIALGQVATIVHGTAPVVINDYAQQPQVTIRTAVAQGVPLSRAELDVDQAMSAVVLPTGYSYLLGGEAQQQSTTLGPLLLTLALAPLLIYMLLAALYESFVLPFTVLLTLPLATVGAFGALVLAHNTLNMMSLIGLLMLVGLVSKNAILLVDYTETRRARGESRTTAVVEAAGTRIRPILMTSLVVVIAMLPIALISAPGSEYRAPMALVLVGGLSTSTLLTLFFVPALYTYLDAGRERIRGRRSRRRVDNRLADPDPAAAPDAAHSRDTVELERLLD